MSFEGKTVVVAGASGVVGSGAVRRFLDAGAEVVGISRSTAKLRRMAERMKIGPDDALRRVEGDFDTEARADATRDAVVEALRGRRPDHVVSSIGFVSVGEAATATPLATLRKALDDGFFNTFLVARSLLPLVRDTPGGSFTMVSGGLAHIPPPMPGLWMGTVKNAAVNALTLALAAETLSAPVRVNTLCIHFGVAPAGGKRNQLGVDAEKDTLALAPAFLGVASGQRRGEVICLDTWASVEELSG